MSITPSSKSMQCACSRLMFRMLVVLKSILVQQQLF